MRRTKLLSIGVDERGLERKEMHTYAVPVFSEEVFRRLKSDEWHIEEHECRRIVRVKIWDIYAPHR